MTIAGAIALTSVVLTVAAIVGAFAASEYKQWEPEYRVRARIATVLAVAAAVGYIAAVWTHALM